MITRFAPTPNGHPHLGNAVSFVITALVADWQKARVGLRLDDYDSLRIEDQYIRSSIEMIQKLGLHWEIGPRSLEQFKKQYSQSMRMELYLDRLKWIANHASDQIYACRCSRAEIKKQNLARGVDDLRYPGTCRDRLISLDEPNTVWRLKAQGSQIKVIDFDGYAWPVIELDDFVIRRRDGLPAYHLVSVLDDLHYQYDLIVRGSDLIESTAAQIELSRRFEPFGLWHSQAQFFHHAQVMGKGGQKLSKSREDQIDKINFKIQDFYRCLSAVLNGSEDFKSRASSYEELKDVISVDWKAAQWRPQGGYDEKAFLK